MIKVGLVGLGKIGKRHLRAYKHVHGVRVTALCDTDKTMLPLGMECYTDYRRLLKQADVDAVDVCVPNMIHHQVILRALDEGKHVFCEKPLTHKTKYAMAIQRRALAHNRVVMVGYLYRFHPSFQLAHQLLQEHVLGQPHLALLRLGGRGGWRRWKHRSIEAGGAILEMLVHLLDLATYWFGEMSEGELTFQDTVLPLRKIGDKEMLVDAEDFVLIGIKNRHGVKIVCEADLVTPCFMNWVEIHGTNGSFIGSIHEEIPTVVYVKQPQGGYDPGKTVIHYPHINLLQKELAYFVETLNGNANPMNTISDSINILAILENFMRK